jgi:phage terminase large subunit-like protein
VLGHALMPWQRRVLDVALEVDEGGRLIFGDVTLTVPRQWGKSYLLLALMLTRALLQRRQGIAYTAQTAVDARKKLLDDWSPMVRANPLGSQATAHLAPGRESLTLSNGSQIQLVASTAKAGHGRVLDLCVLDEAFAYRDGGPSRRFAGDDDPPRSAAVSRLHRRHARCVTPAGSIASLAVARPSRRA